MATLACHALAPDLSRADGSGASVGVGTEVTDEGPVRHLECRPDAGTSFGDHAVTVIAAPILAVEQSDPASLLDLRGSQPVQCHPTSRSAHPPVFDAVPPDDLRWFGLLPHRHRREIGQLAAGLDREWSMLPRAASRHPDGTTGVSTSCWSEMLTPV